MEGKSDEAVLSRRGRQGGSKNTLRTRIDDLSDGTLWTLDSELGLTVRDRAELVVGIYRASGATSKVPKTNLEPLSVATLKRICDDDDEEEEEDEALTLSEVALGHAPGL